MEALYSLHENHGISAYQRVEGQFVLTTGGDLNVSLRYGSILKCIKHEGGWDRDVAVSQVQGVIGTPDYRRGVVVFRLYDEVGYQAPAYNAHRGGIMLSHDEHDAGRLHVSEAVIGTIELPIRPEDMPPQFGGRHGQLRMKKAIGYRFLPLFINIFPDGKKQCFAEWVDEGSCFVPHPKHERNFWLHTEQYPPVLTDEQRDMAEFQGIIVVE